jgi:hypothetical protein
MRAPDKIKLRKGLVQMIVQRRINGTPKELSEVHLGLVVLTLKSFHGF